MAKQSYSLYELNEYIRRVIALNFSEPIWINCEIAQVNNSRGHYYLELVEQDENDQIKAQLSAAIWYRNFLFIKSKLGELTNSLLQIGTQVQLKVRVDFNERYGMKLIIEDIDPSYTLGQLELQRQKILERLKKSGATDLNKQLPLPKVIQRIAVVSSETAAGYQDFVHQAQNNPYGYQYKIDLFQSSMQGQNTEREVVSALDLIKSSNTKYDVIAIMRGGGSKLDLSYFDNYNIALAICKAEIPVITGIGHDIDWSVSDLVAHTSLKTPTAVADFILESSLNFEGEVNHTLQLIHNATRQLMHIQKIQLNDLSSRIRQQPLQKVSLTRNQLEYLVGQIDSTSISLLSDRQRNLEHAATLLNAHNPKQILQKGYTLIRAKTGYVTAKSKLHTDTFEVEFADGSIQAKKL